MRGTCSTPITPANGSFSTPTHTPGMIAPTRRHEKTRAVLAPAEAARLINAAPDLKYRATLRVTYRAGQGADEAIALNGADINHERAVIRFEDGADHRARFAKANPPVLAELCARRRAAKPNLFLSPKRVSAFDHVSAGQLARACRSAAVRARLELPFI